MTIVEKWSQHCKFNKCKKVSALKPENYVKKAQLTSLNPSFLKTLLENKSLSSNWWEELDLTQSTNPEATPPSCLPKAGAKIGLSVQYDVPVVLKKQKKTLLHTKL